MTDSNLQRQLRRQSLWLRESLGWLIRTRMGIHEGVGPGLSALDVGCGPGIVMEMLSPYFRSTGIDIDAGMVRACRARGLEVAQAVAERLPFEDRSFDAVYCSWVLLWVRDPTEVVAEMKRVARTWVFCMAEPDYGARIDHPEDLSELGVLLTEGIREGGGDPHIGRKLRDVFRNCGLEPEIGIHPGVWDVERLRQESEAEWDFVRMTVGDNVNSQALARLKDSWDSALAEGTLMQFNPVFYAIAKVP